jgi:ABC-2 type transport system permease protein
MCRIPTQTFLPAIITTLLYFLIFGSIIGNRIGELAGLDYNAFITPGLVMLAVITNAYMNVSNSLFSVRFQRSIEEILVSPMHWSVLMMGYVFGGLFRGVIIGSLVLSTSAFFTPIPLHRLPETFMIVALVSLLFSLAGFMNGMLARTFDEVAFVPTFVLTPMIYLGGVFYTTTMLPMFWQHITLFNPIFYMVNALRYTLLGHHDNINIVTCLSIIIGFIIVLTAINCVLLKRGTGLRE